MIVVKLMDGLGNQMFQYAFGRYLQVVYDEPIIFETTKLQGNSVRKLGLQMLNIPLVERKDVNGSTCALSKKIENKMLCYFSKFIRVICEHLFYISMTGTSAYQKMIKLGFYTTKDSITYYNFEKTNFPVKFVRGYFQSEKYFSEVSEIIKTELKVKQIYTGTKAEFLKELNNNEAVCVHIRRGDYIGNKRFEICNEEYYKKAMNYFINILDNPVFYVFSNSLKELEWIKLNYNLPGEIKYVTQGENEIDDLCFMYNCKHHIISNSTFSWWGSYLCDNIDNITIAPQKWVNSDEKMDILREKWVLM